MTLLDYSQTQPALPAGFPFSNVQFGYCWSSTTHVDNKAQAWGLGFQFGGIAPLTKPSLFFIWPLRFED